jgi:hypothetical protein
LSPYFHLQLLGTQKSATSHRLGVSAAKTTAIGQTPIFVENIGQQSQRISVQLGTMSA